MDLMNLLSALTRGDLSSGEIWDLYPSELIVRIHLMIDQARDRGYVNDRMEPGGTDRGFRERRMVSITDLGRSVLSNESGVKY